MSNIGFHYESDILFCESLSLANLAESVGTPFYCYSSSFMESQYRNFTSAFSDMDHLVCYSVKANSNRAILSTFSSMGCGADVVSEGELLRCLSSGISADKIVFSGVGKRQAEIDAALSSDIMCFNVESVGELELLSSRAVSLGKRAPISLRINPDIDAGSHRKITTGTLGDKFGVPLSDALSVYAHASGLANLNICGIDVHIGSQITNLSAFESTFSCLSELLVSLRGEGYDIRHIDIGGGLGIDYNDGNDVLSLDTYSSAVKKHLGNLDIRLLLEPGRFLVANSGILLTQVLYTKRTSSKTFIIVDAAMNDLIRPTLYESHHDILPLRRPCDSSDLVVCDVVGPVCESGDYLALNRSVVLPSPCDLFAIMSCGAYGAVQSSTYNSRLLVPEVLVRGSEFHLIRPRGTYDDLLALDSVPSWL